LIEPPYLKFKLENGIEIIAERFDTVQSVSIGMFLKSGVLYEDDEMQGVSHLIEHMMFKGTNTRSPKDIALEFDRIGGVLNAFTAKDYCCYYARVVKDKLEVAIDVLADMLINSRFPVEELEREKKVILEEIKMYEDSPDEIIHELLGQNIWKNSKLGNPILGTAATVSGMKRDMVLDFFHKQYVAGNLLICVAGNFDWENLKSLVHTKLSTMRPGQIDSCFEDFEIIANSSVYLKDIEQVHLTLGAEGLNFADKRRYALTILSAAFGGGMSSRLFQEIREKKGLAYTVYSYHTSIRSTGLFGIYAGTSMENLQEVLNILYQELGKAAAEGLTFDEMNDTKEQVKGTVMLSLENTTNRMNRLSSEFLYGIKTKTPEEAIKPYLEVTQEDIKAVASKILDEKKMAITLIAPNEQALEYVKNSPFTTRELSLFKLGGGINKK
jgi:predicted Zn-dependent peptidase